MATTITYKGNTIASLGDSGTKTLLTQGKYLEGNVVVDNVKTYTATLSRSGDSSLAYVRYPGSSGTQYYTSGDTFTFSEGDTLYCQAYPYSDGNSYIYVNGSYVASSNYNYSLPASDIIISFSVDKTRTGNTSTYVNTTSQAAVQSNRQFTMYGSSATITPSSGFTAMSQVVVDTKSGTAGIPTATKGTVSNNSVTVTPSVTNTTGWITGSTITGTDVTVSADELVSGTLSIDDDGTYDVTNYASADVAIDYTAKAVPVTIYNNSTLPILAVLYSTFVNDILSDGYISNSTTVGIQSNSSISRYIPYGCNFVIRLPAAAATNVDLQINDAIKIPIIEGKKDSSGQYYRLYNLPKNVFNTSGTSMYIIDSTDPLKNNVTLDTLSATSNTTYTAPSGTAYNSVTVAVPASTPSLQSKTATPTESQQSITADSGYDGLSDVTVNAISSTYVGSGINTTAGNSLYITGMTSDSTNYYIAGGTDPTTPFYSSNGAATIGVPKSSMGTATASDVKSSVTFTSANGIGIQGSMDPASVTPFVSESDLRMKPSISRSSFSISGVTDAASGSATTIAPSSGVYVKVGSAANVSQVTPQAEVSLSGYATLGDIYTGNGIYYGASASDDTYIPITTASLPSAATSSATSGYSSGATISASSSDQYINIPAGYNTTGTYYKVNALTNGSVTAPSSISGTGATISTSSNTLTLSKTVSVTPDVTTVGYISSGTARNSDVSLTASVTVNPTPTASGKTVTTPAGYYTISTTTDVATGSATPAASISGTSATISTGTNTITLSKTVSNTPTVSAGYISSGTAGNSDVSLTASVAIDPTPTVNGMTVSIPAGYYTSQTQKSVSSGSATGPSSLSGSSATVTTGTNTITLTKTGVTTTPTVSAGYISSATASTATVSLTASVTTKGAQTYTPGTTDQTISANQYLTGVQTIAGDADLVASNIKDGVNIFGVTGSYSGGGSYPDGDNMGFGGN